MKNIITNYIPKKYRIYSTKKMTPKTIRNGLLVYVGILLMQCMVYFSEDTFINNTDSLFLHVLMSISVTLFVINIANYIYASKKNNVNKWIGTSFYMFMILAVFLLLGDISFLLDNPFTTFLKISISTILFFLTVEVLYLFSVKISITNNNYKTRDNFFNVLLNGVGLVGIVFLFISDFTDNSFLVLLGCACILTITLLLATIHLNRILLLWKPNNSNNDGSSIYGNSIEMMKNKKTKK
ncbi:hypothetical protein [Enterococcus faecalis]|uniref:hypothetical protein n=1 Tax=Enterococcus faecalis TaxID=1351 RepID=UPI00338FBB50